MQAKLDEARALIADVRKWHGEKFDEWRARTTGPFWPVLRRYVKIVEYAEWLLSYVDELTEIIEEQDDENR